jgi:hypothetical protein
MKILYLASSLTLLALITSGFWASARAVTFTPSSDNGAPSQATGGASRGSLFTPSSDNGAPSQATGGASRGGLFTPSSNNGAPSQATGGASRTQFIPASGNGAPSQATGGASRTQFTPAAGNEAPQQATGGASRGTLFTPGSDSAAPQEAVGGASRTQFTPAPDQATPQQAVGGASRTQFTPAPDQATPQQAAGGASRTQFTPAPDNRAPQQAAGASSRVGTYYINPSMGDAQGPAALIALLPQNYYGTTLSERPTLLIHLPTSNAEEAVFSLKDEAGNLEYQMIIPVAGISGIIEVKLPAEAPTLALEKNYQWVLALKVDGELSPSTPYVDGWIQRIQPSAALAAAMQEPDGLKRATALGQSGVWYDCVATLASLYTHQPNDATLTREWGELLTSVGLSELTTAPILVSAN